MAKKRLNLSPVAVLLCGLNFIVLSVFSQLSIASEQPQLTIAFGSCANQNRPQAIWDQVLKHQPALFIAMGDNVYSDSDDPKIMQQAYDKLAANPNYRKFSQQVPIIATWDDHDYGAGDGGKEFVGKYAAKKAFKAFFKYPETEQIKDGNVGVFHSRWMDFNKKKIHIIMLDTRWYRDPIVKSYLTDDQRKTLNLGPYQPGFDKNATILGDTQWQWLKQQLSQKADLIILVSSIQVLNEYSGWEIWANFPAERLKLLDLITDNTDNNLIIVSGDVHRAEITEIIHKNKRLLEITSSGLAVKTYPAAINNHRVGEAINALNYGLLSIQSNDSKINLLAKIFDADGKQRLSASMEID